MAFGDLLKSTRNPLSSVTGVTADLGSAPTSGNLLIFGVCLGISGASVNSVPSGWVLITGESTGSSASWYWYYKISNGSEQQQTWGFDSTIFGTSNYHEYEWGQGAPTVVSTEDLTNISTTSTTQNTGSINPSTNNNICLALHGIDGNANATTESLPGGWTADVEWGSESTTRGDAKLSRILNQASASSLDCTATHTGTADEMYGAIAAFSYTPSGPSVAVTGTITPSVPQAEIVSGGRTIILTLTNDTWVASGATFDAQRQAIIDGITSQQTETTGWNNEVRDKEVVGSVVRTSNTAVTITLSASSLYAITANETIDVTVPASALVTSGSPVSATSAFSITSASSASMSWSGILPSGYRAGVTGNDVAYEEGVDGDGTEAIRVTNTSGTLTINVQTGATPPSVVVPNGATTIVNVVANQITVDVNVKTSEAGNANIQDAGVYIYEDGNTANVYINGYTDASGNISSSPFTYTADTNVKGWVRQLDLSGTDYVAKEVTGVIQSNGATINVQLDPI